MADNENNLQNHGLSRHYFIAFINNKQTVLSIIQEHFGPTREHFVVISTLKRIKPYLDIFRTIFFRTIFT